MSTSKKLLSAFLALLIITLSLIIAPANITASAEVTQFDPQHAYIDFSEYNIAPQTEYDNEGNEIYKNNLEHRYQETVLKNSPWGIGEESGNKFLKYEINWNADKQDSPEGNMGVNHCSMVATRVKGATTSKNTNDQTLLDYSGNDNQHIVLKAGVKYRISLKYKLTDTTNSTIRFRVDAMQSSQNANKKTSGNNGVTMLSASNGNVNTTGTGKLSNDGEWHDLSFVLQPDANELFSGAEGDEGTNYLRLRWGAPTMKAETTDFDFSLCIDDLQIDTIGTANVGVYENSTDTTKPREITFAPACAYNENLFSTKADFAGGILNEATGQFESINKSFAAVNMTDYGVAASSKLNGIFDNAAFTGDALAAIPAVDGATYYAGYTTDNENTFTAQHIDVDFSKFPDVLEANNMFKANNNTGKDTAFHWSIQGDAAENKYLQFERGDVATGGSKHFAHSFMPNSGGNYDKEKEMVLASNATYRIKFNYKYYSDDFTTFKIALFDFDGTQANNSGNTGSNRRSYLTVTTVSGDAEYDKENNGYTFIELTKNEDSNNWYTAEATFSTSTLISNSRFLNIALYTLLNNSSLNGSCRICFDNIQVDRIGSASVTKIKDGKAVGEAESVTYAPKATYNAYLFSATSGDFEGGIWNATANEYQSVDTYFAATEQGVTFNGLYDAAVDGTQVVYMPVKTTAESYYAKYGTRMFTDEFNYGLDSKYQLNSSTKVTIIDDADEAGDKVLKLAKTDNNDSKLFRRFTGLQKNVQYKLKFSLKIAENTGENTVGYAGISTTQPVVLNDASQLNVANPAICSYTTDVIGASYSTVDGKGAICYSAESDWATYTATFVSKDTEAYFYIENSGNLQDMLVDNIMLERSFESSHIALGDFNVPDKTGDTINVLMIGNSYTNDAAREISAAANSIIEKGDVDLRIATWTNGGKNVEYYTEQIQNSKNEMKFRYYANGVTEKIQSRNSVSFESVVNMLENHNQKWDYIVVQAATNAEWEQYSRANSSAITELVDLKTLINEQKGCENSKVVVYGTWAATDEFLKDKEYMTSKTQEKQREHIIKSIENMENVGLEVINMEEIFNEIRNNEELNIGNNLNRDGYHLNNIGATAVGLALYEYFTGVDATTLAWSKTEGFVEYVTGATPATITAEQITGIKKIVHKYIGELSPVTTPAVAGLFVGSDVTENKSGITFEEGKAIYKENGVEYAAFRVYGEYICPADDNGEADPTKIMVDGAAKNIAERNIYAGIPANTDITGQGNYELKSTSTNLRNVWSCTQNDDGTYTVRFSLLLKGIKKEYKDYDYEYNATVTYYENDTSETTNTLKGTEAGGTELTAQKLYEAAKTTNSGLGWFSNDEEA